MIPLFEYEGKPWFPLGLPMSQNRMSIPTWSYAMEKYPPLRIIEIGTNAGGFTVALGIHASRIGAHIYTFDTADGPDGQLNRLWNILPITYHKMNCFKAAGFIAGLIQAQGLTFVLCDGGDKPRELNLFAHYLKPGDVIAGHDYSVKEEYWPWREITLDQVQETVTAEKLEPFMQEHFDIAGWLAFRKA